MKERPLLFSAPMVLALLNGTKTQTRRILKPQPYEDPKHGTVWEPKGKNHPTGSPWYCVRNVNWNPITNAFFDFWSMRGGSPYGAPSDRLWVKETHGEIPENGGTIVYRASDPEWGTECGLKWKPSIFMRREYSRITLEIESVRAEQLQNISPEDAIAEGIEVTEITDKWDLVRGKTGEKQPHYKFYGEEMERLKQQTSNPVWSYETLWKKINGEESWAANPWVWVYTFRKL
jgi:hypothetical protein